MLEFVEQILDSQDNIIDQLKLLKANKNNKEVKKYMQALLKDRNSPYFNYCINKYYLDKDIDEVEPTAKDLNITLYKIHFKDVEEKKQKKLNKVKKGDKVKILDGPFKDEIGILNSYDIDNMKIFVTLCLFGQNIDIEHDGRFEIIKEKRQK